MITIITAQILRESLGADPFCHQAIDNSIEDIFRFFINPEYKALMEQVGPGGEFIDHSNGRILNPGHAIEAAWFILNEAAYRNRDKHLIRLGTQILDWMWEWGWDKKYGGIIHYRDVKGHPVQEYWHDMKFWWPQNEAVIATLTAYALTGDEKYAHWHRLVHDWAYSNFPDSQYGEWFGYLHRDGSVSQTAKGNIWKGPFHIPRMQLTCWNLLKGL